MAVTLISDQVTRLFSSDKDFVNCTYSSDEYKFTECNCGILDCYCVNCNHKFGYSIKNPCTDCLQSDNNGHLNMARKVRCHHRYKKGERAYLRWSNLQMEESKYIRFLLDEQDCSEESANEYSELKCSICLLVMLEPMKLTTCSHTFCKNCIMTTIDLYRVCPADKIRNNHQYTLNVAIQDQINYLDVYCGYENCGKIMQFKDLQGHQEKCPYKVEMVYEYEGDCVDVQNISFYDTENDDDYWDDLMQDDDGDDDDDDENDEDGDDDSNKIEIDANIDPDKNIGKDSDSETNPNEYEKL